MPLYEYRCPRGHHVIKLRKYEERDELVICLTCELSENFHNMEMVRIWSLPHILPDGCYSYAPAVGNMETFDRKMHKIEINKARKKDGLRPGFEEG